MAIKINCPVVHDPLKIAKCAPSSLPYAVDFWVLSSNTPPHPLCPILTSFTKHNLAYSLPAGFRIPISVPEPSGTSSRLWTGTLWNLTLALHQNLPEPPEPYNLSNCTGTSCHLLYPPEPCPEPPNTPYTPHHHYQSQLSHSHRHVW